MGAGLEPVQVFTNEPIFQRLSLPLGPLRAAPENDGWREAGNWMDYLLESKQTRAKKNLLKRGTGAGVGETSCLQTLAIDIKLAPTGHRMQGRWC